jgi:hypothetical protein
MSTGITKKYGTALPATLHGGYQLRWFKFVGDFSDTSVGGVFDLAVRGVEKIATVVVLGTPTAGGFIVGIDGGSFRGRGDSTGYAADTSVADLDAAVYASSGTNPTTTEIIISGAAFANA